MAIFFVVKQIINKKNSALYPGIKGSTNRQADIKPNSTIIDNAASSETNTNTINDTNTVKNKPALSVLKTTKDDYEVKTPAKATGVRGVKK